MLAEIVARQSELRELCQRFCVRRLELLGSATDDRFDSTCSDLDSIVEFDDLRPGQYADAYFGLLYALRELFDRPVDLVVASAVRSPYLLAEIAAGRMVLYEAA